MHSKTPYVESDHDTNLASSLLDVICDHRIRPPLKMPISLGVGEHMVGFFISLPDAKIQIGLPGRLIDYYPKVEFLVWRKDHCPENLPPVPGEEEDDFTSVSQKLLD